MTLSEELKYRGMVYQTTYKDLKELDVKPLTFYWGVDPSADSLTVGHLAAAMMVKCFIKHNYKAVLLVGGATGLIGDPDGKSSERDLKTFDEISKNKQSILKQYEKIYGKDNLQVVDNYDWFKECKYLDFLRDIGKHVPMRQMLGREFVVSRLSDDGRGISYAEFSYVLIQAYDFLHLNKNFNVSVQVCGADQWGNCIAGVDLIRRINGKPAQVFSTPLIIDDQTNIKFGKSESGAIWLDPLKTSPTKFFQFWINLNDDNVEKYLKIFTDFNQDQINGVISKHNADPGKRFGQNQLAISVTKMIHGERSASLAEKITEILIGQTPLEEISDEETINQLRMEIPSVKTSLNGEIAEAVMQSGLSDSKTTARQLLKDQAIYINGQKVTREVFVNEDFINNRLLLRKGKAFKDSALIEVE